MMILGLIPARSGSKGVPQKNIRPLAGYPLIAYAIAASKLSSRIERTVVSTDSQEFAEIARSYGAEVPFLRPPELAADNSTDMDWVLHSLEWFQSNEGYYPEYLVHLRPTTPLRDPDMVDAAIDKIIQHKEATSLRSVHPAADSAYKLLGIEDGYLAGLFPDDPRPEYYNLPRQMFPPTYYPNGYVDILKSELIVNAGSLHGPRMLPFIAPDTGEVDRPEDFDFIEFVLGRQNNPVYEYLKNNYPVRS